MRVNRSGDDGTLDVAALTDAAERLLNRGTAAGNADQVRQAVELSESVLAVMPLRTAEYVGASANTGRALIAEYEMTGRAGALDRAIRLLDDAEPDSGMLGDRGADFFSILGQALLRDAERTALPDTAERAVAAQRGALALTSRDDAAYSSRLSDLAAILTTQFRITGKATALREAVRVHKGAIRRFNQDDPGLPGLLSNLGTCLDELAMSDGNIPVLEEAVDVQRGAIEAAAISHPLHPMITANLGVTLMHLHQLTGAPAGLEEAIQLDRNAVAETPEEHVDYQPRQTNLAAALQTLYEETGLLDALNEAIDIFQQAVDRTPLEHTNRLRYQHGLTSALMRLAQRNGDLSAVDEAIQTWQEITDSTPDGHPSKPGRLSALATAQFMRFQSNPADLSQLDAGIENLRNALHLSPGQHTQRAMLLTNLGALLLSRFEQTNDPDALDEAVRMSRDAIAASALQDADRGRYLSNLGVMLVQQAGLSDNISDSHKAIDIISQALSIVPSDDPGRADTLIAMGAARTRAFELGDPDAFSPGLDAFREAAGMQNAPAEARIRAGRDGGRLAVSGSSPGDAFGAFADAVRLMDDAVWVGMSRIDQQRLLGELNGLPMDAAAMAIEADHPGEAVELLEQGRGMLLARQLEAPGLHAQLTTVAPEIAQELAWVRAALHDTEQDNNPGLPPGRAVAARRSRLAQRHVAILNRLRADPDLRHLVGPPQLEELLAAASQGPVVIVNVSEYRCDALVMSEGQVRTVPLPRLTKQAVAEQVQALLDAADDVRTAEVHDVLSWTWDCVVEPVFTDLGLTTQPPAGQETHLWWCPTGLTAFLPLHAAGARTSNAHTGDSALYLAVSSYTPTLRTLIQLRQRQPAQEASPSGPLIVAMPKTPGQPDLDSATEEADDIEQRAPVHELLTGTSATRDAVAEAMPHHLWAHYACHGSQELHEPFRGALHVHDGPLSITQIMNLQLPDLVLAYLSACETSRGSTLIPDEGITLASALQIAGYQHVIGTLWQISGISSTNIAKDVYNQIITVNNGITKVDSNAVAAALRSATIELRSKSPDMPAMYWAPYIHTGP
jgi:tetratricopeptide (TPR) repeat protein